MNYLLDANILIDSKNKEYPFDFFPGYWDFLRVCFSSGSAIMHKKVFDEIDKGKDELSLWVNDNKDILTLANEDSKEEDIYFSLCEWAESKNSQYTARAIDVFCDQDRADIWLCAKAKDKNCTIVTSEVFDGLCKTSIKIPNVCKEMDILYMNKFEFIRSMRAKFLLKDGFFCPS